MATLDADTEAVPQVVFRPGKKRKMYRQRAEDHESTADDNSGNDNNNDKLATEAVPTVPGSEAAAPIEHEADGEEGLSVAEVLRLRNQRKHKHGGVGFRAGPSSSFGDDRATPSEENTEQGLILHGSADPTQQAAESAVIGGISKRFAPQTGLVGELVNKHMEEYVESALARRKRRQQQQQELEQEQEQERQRRANGTTSTSGSGQSNSLSSGQADAQRVLHGRLLEIDLGEEARARNVAMTERARRRLQGQIDEEEDQQDDEGGGGGGKGRPRKVRLGRDGRPLRSRNRRGSDDVKRDQLVEEFLSENRLNMYDTTTQQPGTSTDPTHSLAEEGDGDDMAADDRIAEEFRREFMEAMSQRNRRRRAPQQSGPNSKNNQEEILRGPKLGGSRNARAAMRDLLLKEQVAKGRGR